METDFNLYTHIITAVEKQIAENDPKIVKATYDRLLASGHDDITAKEKIASVIAEEIYSLLKSEDKKLNEEQYAEKLSQLS